MTTWEKADFVAVSVTDNEMLRKTTEMKETEKVLTKKAMEVFSEKLSEKGYSNEEISKILEVSENFVKRKLMENGFAILWTIRMDSRISENEKIDVLENLVSIFEKLKIDIKKLGFFVLEIDPMRRELLMSDRFGVRPKKIA